MRLYAIANDFQFPFADLWANDLFLTVCWREGVDGVILNGDILDCPQFSDFDRDPRRASRFHRDVQQVRSELLSPLNWVNEKVWVDGNHEARLPKYLVRKAPELMETHPGIDSLLELSERGWMYVPYREHFFLGKLIVTHGQSYSTVPGMSVRKEMGRYGQSVIMGHTHRIALIGSTDLRGPHVGCENGHMSDASKLTWIKDPNWQQCFALVHVDDRTKEFHIQQLPLLGERRNKRVFYGPKTHTLR